MKKKILTLSLVWTCLVLFTISSSAQEKPPKFNLKLSGGYGKVVGGDLPAVIEGINQLARDQADRTGASVTSYLENAEWGPEFEFEFVYNFNQRFGLGLGIGYICRKNDTYLALELGSLLGASLAMDYTASTIPVLLSGYYYLPLGSKTKAYLKAGTGYYFGKLNSNLREEATVAGITIWEEDETETKDSGFGLQGAVGFELNLSKTIALFAEATGRYVKLNNWEGENVYSTAWGTDKEKGYFWYAEVLNHETGKHYPSLTILPHEPTWAEYRNVRKAEFNFSGYALKLGVKVGF